MPEFAAFYERVWPWLLTVSYVVLVLVAGGHAILHKRDVRAAIGWSGLILLSPFFGAAAYYFLGINRIRRKGERLAVGRSAVADGERAPWPHLDLTEKFDEHVERLNRTVGQATGAPLLPGNSVTPLINGDAGYPAMLAAIEDAERSVLMTSYIFDNDTAGERFVEALAAASERGVEVRVLIDAVGKRYSRPPITRVLKRRGVQVAEFLPTRTPLRHPYMNLRNHRKLLIVDGRSAFTGGLNVRECCVLDPPPAHPTQDIHFRFEGPVVQQMFTAAHEDWFFATRETLSGPAWACTTAPRGDVGCRGIPDGPDEDFETIRWTILAALGAATRSVRIASPYFLPERPMVAALRLAALRGVEVDILLPEKNNLRFVQWATQAQLWQVLQPGCRVWLSPPPFDHSKLMIVDDFWSLVGSANWDERSLRLNFEFNVECYDRELASRLTEFFEEKRRRSRRFHKQDVDARPLPVRLRDGVARLFSPYL